MNLLSEIKNGSEFAFEQAFLAHKEKVYHYFLQKTGTTHYAEDLLHNTFLRLWKYRSSLNDEYLLEQHLFNFARSVFIDHTRSLNKLSKVEALVKQELQTAKAALSDELDREKLLLILNAMPGSRPC